MMRLFVGPEQILNAFNCLPKTKHSLGTDPTNYSIETVSYPALGGMMITLHGEFEEVGQPDQQFADITSNSNKGHGYNKYKNNQNRRGILEKRCFDRVFVVVPGANGAFIVASDMLCIKLYSAKKSWNNVDINSTFQPTPSSSSVPVTINTPIPQSLPADVAGRLNLTQQELVLKIMTETRLKLEFVLMLCEQSNWDYTTAGQNFINSKSNIPPDAYV